MHWRQPWPTAEIAPPSAEKKPKGGFMGIQVIALILLYVFPEIGLWLPKLLYK